MAAGPRGVPAQPRERVSRVDTAELEPRYLRLLESERRNWWSSGNFDVWKNLYISEYARGYHIRAVLAAYAPDFRVQGAHVLDIGCGDAGVPIALAEAGGRAAGIERDARSVERGRVRAEEHGVEVELRQGVAEHLPFPASSFDLVILDNVLEHVEDRERTLAEVHRALRPAGLLYLVMPKPFALYHLWSDPHYGLAGLVLLPRRLQRWYFERVRRAGTGAYQVGVIPTRRRARRLLAAAGFRSLVAPRELWIDYLRDRITRPEEVSPGLKRRLARWLGTRCWPFENPVARWAWDVALGSNIFLARRRP